MKQREKTEKNQNNANKQVGAQGTVCPKSNQHNKGITLVALIITIIILVILVGVSVSVMLNSGIIGKSKTATENYALEQAKEKLELALSGAKMEKYTNPDYDQDRYLTTYIMNETGAAVSANTVILDGYTFEIDRSVPKISMVIGKGQKEETIKITSEVVAGAPYATATITVTVKSEQTIDKIVINGQETSKISNVDNTYTTSIEVSNNGNYSIIAYAQDKYNYNTVEVTELADNMEIRTKEELIAFRDKVNAGATYEGKTITLESDINLNGTENNQWIPIGSSESNMFKGKFEGNGNKITGLFINSTEDYIGLFGWNEGTISDLLVTDSKVSTASSTTTHIAIIAGYNNGIISKCGNESEVTGSATNNGYIGGISGYNATNGEIRECYNKGIITATTYNHWSYAGGIVGYNGGVVEDCYNRAQITNYRGNGATHNSNAGGITGETAPNGKINNCYSTATVKSTDMCGNIAGCSYGTSSNTYWLRVEPNQYANYYGTGSFEEYCKNCSSKSESDLKTAYSQLGEAYKEDNEKNIINDGYPILKWQLEQ